MKTFNPRSCAGRFGPGLLGRTAVRPRSRRWRAARCSAPPRWRRAYAQIPMSFEANVGQTAAQVQYLARGAGYTVFLTPNEAVVSLEPTSPNAQGSSRAVVQMQWEGANAASPLVAQDQLASTSNYLIGNDPSDWHTNVPNFGQVDEQGVYPGVNLTYHGNQQQLEYDFTVEPGASPRLIRLAITGRAESIAKLDAQGDLELHTAAGDLQEPAPVLYQEIGGSRQVVSGHYVLEPDGQVGFAVGAYDTSQPLVIDPTLVYSTFWAATAMTRATPSPWTPAKSSTSLGLTTSTTSWKSAASREISAAKTSSCPANAAGTLVYSTYVGADGSSQANAIAVNAAGDAYITGTTTWSDPDRIRSDEAQDGDYVAFVAELNPATARLVYSTYSCGTENDDGEVTDGNGIAVDSSGNAYVTGSTNSYDFPTTSARLPTAARRRRRRRRRQRCDQAQRYRFER